MIAAGVGVQRERERREREREREREEELAAERGIIKSSHLQTRGYFCLTSMDEDALHSIGVDGSVDEVARWLLFLITLALTNSVHLRASSKESLLGLMHSS